MIEMALTTPQHWRPLPWSTTKVRISNDVRRCVVFLGDCDVDGSPPSFEPYATAFLMSQHGVPGATYLVTAKHCVKDGDPFWIRMNAKDGARLIPIESPEWIFHTDDTVDLAVMEFAPPAGCLFVPVWDDPVRVYPGHEWSSGFGPGDLTYTIGLFRAHGGTKKNIPLVHTGHIAAFSEDEKIEVDDWDDPTGKKRKLIDAFIVQCSAMPGSSGSPVFVRKPVEVLDERHTHDRRGKTTKGFSYVAHTPPQAYGPVRLLGVWRGSWELPEKDFRARATIRYPAGYGTIVPGEKIEEILNMPHVKEKRDKAAQASQEARRAKKETPVADSVPRPRKSTKKVFDATLKRMLDTPPDPRVKNK